VKHWLRVQVEKVLRRYGYELKIIDDPMRGFAASLAFARSLGLNPKTVFDVGVGYGTRWLYDAFPDAKFVLFEPMDVFEGDLTKLERELGADVHRVALADRTGHATFRFNSHFPTSSSLYAMDPRTERYLRCVQGEHEFTERTVQLETLDGLNTYEPPYVLKLDVEGGDLAVIRGAVRTLANTDLVVSEVSVMRRYQGEPSFATVIRTLDQLGFELFDIPSLAQANGNGALLYLDAMFVKKDSKLWPR
jgi:FkbM family methyltransferase